MKKYSNIVKNHGFAVITIIAAIAFTVAAAFVANASRPERIENSFSVSSLKTPAAFVGAPKSSIASPTPMPIEPININEAGITLLTCLPGIGDALAQRIISYRDEHGPFSCVEDLLNVSGIGEKKLEGFREYVLID